MGMVFDMNRAVGGLVLEPTLDGRTDQGYASLVMGCIMYIVACVFGNECLDFDDFAVVTIRGDQ